MIYVLKESEIDSSAKICYYFYAPWLIFHKKMNIMLEKLETEYPDIKFYAIDIEHLKTFARAFEIKELPFLYLKGNGAIKNIKGVPLIAGLRKAFNDTFKD